MRDRRRAAAGLAIALAIAAAVAGSLHLAGRGARRVRPGHEVVQVHDGAGALSAWRASGVHGRVMLWLDRQLPLAPVDEAAVEAYLGGTGPPPGVEESFLYLAMRENLVRRVVYLVPDDRWAAYAAAESARADVRHRGSGFVTFVEGVPLVMLAAKDRAEALDEEPPLVHRAAAARELFSAAAAQALDAEAARADLVTELR